MSWSRMAMNAFPTLLRKRVRAKKRGSRGGSREGDSGCVRQSSSGVARAERRARRRGIRRAAPATRTSRRWPCRPGRWCGSRRSARSQSPSDPLDADLAEEPVRFDHEDDDEGGEGRHLLHASPEHGVEVAAGEIFQDSDDEAPDDGAEHAVEPAEDDDRQRLEAQHRERAVGAAPQRPEQDAAQGGDRRRDAPGDGEDPPDRDAHRLRDLLREGSRAHGDSNARVAEEEGERGEEDAGRDDAEQIAAGDGQGAEMDRLALEEGREGPRVGTPDAEDDGAQDAGEAERNHDDGDDRLADHRPQDEPLHGEAEQHREDDGESERPGERDVHVLHHRPEDVRAEEQELALGEVQDAARLVDDDEAQGDEGVDAPHHEAVDGELEEELHQPARSSRTARSDLMRAVLPSWKRMVVSMAMWSTSP